MAAVHAMKGVPIDCCRTSETPRAPVRKIRFAPGKGNTKLMVLYASRMDIKDASNVRVYVCQPGSV